MIQYLYRCYFILLMLLVSNLTKAQVQLPNCPPDGKFEYQENLLILEVGSEINNVKIPWKVVVSGAAESEKVDVYVKGYKKNSNQTYFNWEIGTGTWNSFNEVWPTLPEVHQVMGICTIPRFTLPDDNNWFGDIFGTIKFYDNQGNYSLSADTKPNKKVKVFFRKNDINPLSPNQEPNWFYYWKKFIPMGKITGLIYDPANTNYGSTPKESTITKIGKLASEGNWITSHSGLHSFYETIAHENHHINLFEMHWPNGWNAFQDTDKDWYPDDWEDTSQDGIKFKFNSGESSDIYDDEPNDSDEIAEETDPNPLKYPGTSSGYRWEETECNLVEWNLEYYHYDSKDWSYDPLNLFQGKNW